MYIVVTLDCLDLEAQATFWTAALAPLGYRRSLDASPYLSLTSPKGPPLLLQRVQEPKQHKNRMHLDLAVGNLEPELQRLTTLDATILSDECSEIGFRWSVLADPEGNEFCIFVDERPRRDPE